VRVLLDTDVLIDLALDREPFAEPAAALFELLERRPGLGWIAWHSASTFYYLVAPERGPQGARQFLMELSGFVGVAETTTESLRFAAALEVRDFEDAMQAAAARACGADLIITRNLKDYRFSPIPATTPQALVDELVR
jgi:predicted nucleic acid-binding protein